MRYLLENCQQLTLLTREQKGISRQTLPTPTPQVRCGIAHFRKAAAEILRDKKKAETYAELKEIELLNQGKEGVLFSTEDRILSQRAVQILKPYGKTVLDAAEFYARHLKTISGSRKVSEVVSELLAPRAADGLSVDYLSDLKIKFQAFSRKFGESMIAGITAKEISTWLRELNVGIVSRNTTRSRPATFFSFAKKQGHTQANPIADVGG